MASANHGGSGYYKHYNYDNGESSIGLWVLALLLVIAAIAYSSYAIYTSNHDSRQSGVTSFVEQVR